MSKLREALLAAADRADVWPENCNYASLRTGLKCPDWVFADVYSVDTRTAKLKLYSMYRAYVGREFIDDTIEDPKLLASNLRRMAEEVK